MPFKLGPLELVLMLVVLLVNIGVITAVVLLVRYLFFRKTNKNAALDIAEQRYARGEITETQLQEIKRNLT
jgi:uncharacterized membrane protein